MKKGMGVFIAVVVVLVLVFLFLPSGSDESVNSRDTNIAPDSKSGSAEPDLGDNAGDPGVPSNLPDTPKAGSDGSSVKSFVLTGNNFKFVLDGENNPDLTVKKGDTVKVEFESTGGFHDFVIDEFDAATEKVSSGGKTSVEFVADTVGTFEYYCSVGSHRANGMKGKFIVEA